MLSTHVMLSVATSFSTVAAAPTINSLEQTNPTTVRASWTASSASSVTGYKVHYRLSGGSETVTDIMSSTSRDITGLTQGETYVFLVEVITSNQLPGESEEMTITLGEWFEIIIVHFHHSLPPSLYSSSRPSYWCGSYSRVSLSQSVLADSG